jgi:2,3-bisphosphoglycerate-dependent phosphoglycerate mutase
MKLYLIRHGQPEIAEYAGFPGPKLSLYGKRQAKTICEILKKKEIEIVFTSDYIRVIETVNPFLTTMPTLKFIEAIEIREREKDFESHESLVDRVQTWFENKVNFISTNNVAIFGHCGSLNMILNYLDKDLSIIEYPFEDKFKCLTPIGGIWELTFNHKNFVGGRLFHNGQV